MPKAGIGRSQGTVFIPPRTEGQGGASGREYFGGSHDNAPLLQGKPTGSPMGHGLFRVLRSVLQDHLSAIRFIVGAEQVPGQQSVRIYTIF
jgi:hypothetical protein